ncbi:MAG TPA: hypothetical protein VFI56_01040 [Vicinamibacterales bacterium]|nr:hypothetical protein [Vicinamibacterales bacterium]
MRKKSAVAVVLLAAALVPSPALAWGAVAHRYIMRRAIDLLPPEIKPFFEHHRDELVLRANDPDLWRVVGFEDEPPNHQIDFGVEDYGPYPFVALPREYDAAVEKFGVAVVRRHGLLPWRTMEEFGNLRRLFQGFARNQLYVEGNTVLFASTLGHYIQDAFQPLHVHNNYDGQLSGQTGLHSRFEAELFERFESRLTINPGPVKPVASARDFIFDTVLASFQLVPKILAADRDAIGIRDAYDDAYFEAFFTNIRPVLEQQLAGAITGTASAIVGAWTEAGKPALKTSIPRAVQKVKKP